MTIKDTTKKRKGKKGDKAKKVKVELPKTNRPRNESEILDKLFEFFSNPKTEPSEDDLEVKFYNTKIKALPLNSKGERYNGVNVAVLLATQDERDINVPVFSTFKQAQTLIAKNKNLPEPSDSFDPEKPMKGVRMEASVIYFLAKYMHNDEEIEQEEFEEATEGMTFQEMRENGYSYSKNIIPYNVFPIERVKDLLTQEYLDSIPLFKQQQRLDKDRRMNPKFEDEYFVEQTQLIINAMGVEVIEKDIGQAYYSVLSDTITIPPRHRFSSDAAYYSVVRHELTHATGHPSRLNRKLGYPSDSIEYSREELTAEYATMLSCIELNGGRTFHAHAKYLSGWASMFKDKKKALLSICSDAKEAQQYISDKVSAYLENLEK
ncbi:TPA: DUF1738 domain-containing protein [Vibrio parahaemolyticus]|nr:DUF1738 domain-containing protein [Vibrio parahaemolyticus]